LFIAYILLFMFFYAFYAIRLASKNADNSNTTKIYNYSIA